jgi:hypothetical protein
MKLLLTGYQCVDTDQLTLDQYLVKAFQSNPPFQCATIGAQDANVSYAPIHALETPVSVGCFVQDANRVGARDARYPANLYTLHSLQDTKLTSYEE